MATETTNPQRGSESGGAGSDALTDAARLFEASWGGVEFEEEQKPSNKTNREPQEEPDEEDVDSEAESTDEGDEEAFDELLPDDDTDDDEDTGKPATKVRLRPDDEVELPDGTTVKYSELVANASKGADYTRKTQELSTARSTVNEVTKRYQQLETTLNEQLGWVNTLIQQVMPREPDVSLMSTDIVSYMEQKAIYEKAMGVVNGLKGVSTEQKQRAQKLKADRAALEAHLFQEKLPHLRDPKALKKFTERFVEAMPVYGFTPEEVDTWTDHRVYMMIDDALYGRAVRAGQAKAKQEAEKVKQKALPPVVKPGNRNTKPATAEVRRRSRALDQLKKTGDLRAGAASILHLLDK
jgi:hypothetical protein